MSQATLLFESVREVIIEALESATGFLSNQAIFEALKAGQIVAFGQIGLDRFERREVADSLKARLGVEIARNAFDADETIDALARRLADRLPAATVRSLLS